jgi:hypothetical protein
MKLGSNVSPWKNMAVSWSGALKNKENNVKVIECFLVLYAKRPAALLKI